MDSLSTKSLPKLSPLNILEHSSLRLVKKCLLFLCDILSYILALSFVQILRYPRLLSTDPSDTIHILWPLTIILIVYDIFGLYGSNENPSALRGPGRIIVASGISFLLITLVLYFFGMEHFVGNYFGRGIFLGTIIGFSISASAHRILLNKLFERAREKRHYLVLADHNEFNSLLNENRKSIEKERFNLLDTSEWDDLLFKINETNYTGIIAGHEASQNDDLVKKLMKLRFSGIRIFTIDDFFENVWLKVPVLNLKDQWFVTERGLILFQNPVGFKIKRIVDLVLSVLLLIIVLPLMLVVFLLVKMTSRGPGIYSQIRTGENGEKFTLYKFRSMNIEAESGKPQWAQEDDPRVTKFGKFLRIMRIDELPQLWNVLKGEMSFIGPRPERPYFTDILRKEIPYYDMRHLVRPGITGWSQVLYPYGASVEDALEKLQYDLYYIKNYSILLDFNIIIKTIRVVFFGKGGR